MSTIDLALYLSFVVCLFIAVVVGYHVGYRAATNEHLRSLRRAVETLHHLITGEIK